MPITTHRFIMIMISVNVYKEPDTVHNLYYVFKKGDESFFLPICSRHTLDYPLAYNRQFILNNAHSPELGDYGSIGTREVG